MAGHPTAETPPEGLDAYWLGVWRHCLKTMKAQRTWAWEQRPLLDEYVFALMAARVARFDEQDKTWDMHRKAASSLADQLVLTVRSRKSAGVKAEGGKDDEQDPFAELDELEKFRQSKADSA